MKRRYIATLSALALALSLALGGCGAAGSQAASAPVAPEAGAAAAAQPTAAPSEAPAASAQIAQAAAAPADAAPASEAVQAALAEENSASVLAGPAASEQPQQPQPEDAQESTQEGTRNAVEFVMSSEAGGWSTSLLLYTDGSFTGRYQEPYAGLAGNGYPNGTVYYCDFTGRFGSFHKRDELTWTMAVQEFAVQSEEERFTAGVRYVPTEQPQGIAPGDDFTLYLPATRLEGLSREFISWWPDNWKIQQESLTRLGCYGLCNTRTMQGFFGATSLPLPEE